MSRQIEHALLSLMPTLGSDLPPALVDLSSSLLAQSRNAASTLKADEEIARLYACANIACDRLKISLDLPPIEPRPPIPPRIYKKLYHHLDTVLPNVSTPSRRSTGRTRTPSSRARIQDASDVTPSKSRGTPTVQESLRRLGASTTKPPPPQFHNVSSAALEDGLFPWVRPVTKYLCNDESRKRMRPSLVAGLEYIVAPGGRRVKDQSVTGNVPALVVAICCLVEERFSVLMTDKAPTKQDFVARRKDLIAAVNKARDNVVISGIDAEVAWQSFHTIKIKDVDAAVNQIQEMDWLSADWYRGISDIVQNGHNVAHLTSANVEEETIVPTKSYRADSMLQEKYNLTSETKQQEYAAWKGKMLIRINEVLNGNQAMELDE